LAEPRHNSIYVLAGVNGAGKSSVLSAPFLGGGLEVFNPDQATEQLLDANPHLRPEQANSLAWHQGKKMLEAAVALRNDFVFETTLGGGTITKILERALGLGTGVYMSYVGLEGPELHIARVRSRVAAGGHDIPEERIRSRYDTSRVNLIRLLPKLTELRVYDNSAPADPKLGVPPVPELILHVTRGQVVETLDLGSIPGWAKPIVAAALP
jgi:predicted ABC-type ATPase